jgi:hypothetical protein
MSILQKLLAKFPAGTETRRAMKGRSSLLFFLIASFVAAAFLWTLALSASPQLHQWIHTDANRTEHNCAVTFVSSGSFDHGATAPLVSAPVPFTHFSNIPAFDPQWVQSPFLGASIFEHAPPALA